MCTLALYLGQSRRYPLVIAANRDEFLSRPATAPQPIDDHPWVVAGLDLVAGGTWLGVSQSQLACGILNRRTGELPDPQRRSRGLLCLEVLRSRDLEAARALVTGQAGSEYNPFNLLVAAPQAALVAQNSEPRLEVTPLPSGVHLLTNLDLNDPTCPRIAKAHGLFAAAAGALDAEPLEAIVEKLRQILADHSTPLDPRGEGPPNNLCVHRGEYGTRSSTILLFSAAERRYRYFHADGPPCAHAYAEIALPR